MQASRLLVECLVNCTDSFNNSRNLNVVAIKGWLRTKYPRRAPFL